MSSLHKGIGCELLGAANLPFEYKKETYFCFGPKSNFSSSPSTATTYPVDGTGTLLAEGRDFSSKSSPPTPPSSSKLMAAIGSGAGTGGFPVTFLAEGKDFSPKTPHS